MILIRHLLYQGSHFSSNMKFQYFPGYFQVKAMKFQVNLAWNHSVYVVNVVYNKDVNDFFCK